MSAMLIEVAPRPAETIETRYLQPGHLFATKVPTTITTILGSCVAVCLYDRARRIGGMNHFMLPIDAPKAQASPRFGNDAMEMLLQRMLDLGARMPFLEARVFGGACMFAQMADGNHLGVRNAQLAADFLAERRIAVLQTDVGGTKGRKLKFETAEGIVCLSLI
jgi:chemotaxis protein CheD